MPGYRNFLRDFRGNVRKNSVKYYKGINLSSLQAAILSSSINNTPSYPGMISND
jgi:hypothetical protein